MRNFKCGNLTGQSFKDGFLECENCGNHVCKSQAEKLRGVCPHCFGRLCKIS